MARNPTGSIAAISFDIFIESNCFNFLPGSSRALANYRTRFFIGTPFLTIFNEDGSSTKIEGPYNELKQMIDLIDELEGLRKYTNQQEHITIQYMLNLSGVLSTAQFSGTFRLVDYLEGNGKLLGPCVKTRIGYRECLGRP
jgi:hypothetical protein